jgi:hypothetical protein
VEEEGDQQDQVLREKEVMNVVKERMEIMGEISVGRGDHNAVPTLKSTKPNNKIIMRSTKAATVLRSKH